MIVVKKLLASGATFGGEDRYRYRLWRRWAPGPIVPFIMLNPSTADGQTNDPTIRRCIGFAKAWGYAGLEVFNLFAFRSPDPYDLRRVADPIGPDNDGLLEEVAMCRGWAVAAWGGHRFALERAAAVVRLFAKLRSPLKAIRVTKRGHPEHPLYLPGGLVPVPYPPTGGLHEPAQP